MELMRREQTVEGENEEAKINIRSGETVVAVAGGSACEQATRREGGRGFDVISAKVQMWKKKKTSAGAPLKDALTVGQYFRPLRHQGQLDEATSL